MIELHNICKWYGSQQVLHSISARFEPGSVYGIVGKNGAGKTTLFRCIAGLENCDGTIAPKAARLKNKLGFLPTDPYIFSRITGMEYLQLFCNARGVKNVDFQERTAFDLPLHQYASTYSTGMKKKLAVTAILLQPNDFFILDEPFNGVDIQSNILITEIIHRLKALNKVVLLSSHIFSTRSDSCDSIFLLENGRFAQQVQKTDFRKLEQEMKQFSIGDSLDRLGLK